MLSYKIHGADADVRIRELELKIASLERELEWYHRYCDKLQDRLVAMHMLCAQMDGVLNE